MVKYSFFILLLLLIFSVKSVNADNLETVSGTIYKDYKVLKVFPDCLQISHSRGVSKVPFSDLSQTICDKYGYNYKEAQEYIAKREAAQNARAKRKQEILDARDKVRKEEFAAAEASRAEFLRRFAAEAEPFFTAEKTTLNKESGGFIYLDKGRLLTILDDRLMFQGTLCRQANPAPVRAETYFNLQKNLLREVEDRIESIPKEKKDAEEKIVELEAGIARLRGRTRGDRGGGIGGAQPGADGVSLEISRMINEITSCKSKIRDLKKELPAKELEKKELVKQLEASEKEFAEFNASRSSVADNDPQRRKHDNRSWEMPESSGVILAPRRESLESDGDDDSGIPSLPSAPDAPSGL